MTHAPSQSTSVGPTRPQLSPRIFALRITRADPFRFPVVIFLMKDGTSMLVGHALVQGASKQYKHRLASMRACCDVKGGVMSAKFRSYSCGESLGEILTKG